MLIKNNESENAYSKIVEKFRRHFREIGEFEYEINEKLKSV